MRTHPMHGPNRFKLGVFSANADGGLTLTRVPERWPATWKGIVAVAQMADRAGIEFFLPIARWKGFGGEMNSREWSFETLTFAAALAGVTENIALFSTVHVPMVHPVFAAKAMATIDHASDGRAGLNIVCGWNPEEFAAFGLEVGGDRYEQGLEWFEVMRRIHEDTGAVRLRREILPAEGRFGASGADAAPAPGDAERRVLAAGPRLRRQGRRFPVHDLHRDRQGACADRGYFGTGGPHRGARWGCSPRRTWCAARHRPRRRRITSITR